MSAPEAALRDVLGAVMEADAALAAALGQAVRIQRDESRNVAFPYLSWGRCHARPQHGDGVDLIEIRIDLHIWASEGDALALTGAVRAFIDAQPVLDMGPDYRLVALNTAFCDVLRVRDPRTRRGVLRLRALIQSL